MKQINNVQTKDYIVEAIRNEILSGNIAEGEELTQEALAEVLGVSRMPVREALQTLVQEGFVERLKNRHMRVQSFAQSQIEENFRVIASLESEVAAIFIEKEVSTQTLVELLDKMERAEDETAIGSLEFQFHETMFADIKNQYLLQVSQQLLSGFVQYVTQNLGVKNQKRSQLRSLYQKMQLQDIQGIRETLCQYYMEYAQEFCEQRMTKHGDKDRNE